MMSRRIFFSFPLVLLMLWSGLRAGEYNLPQIANGEGIQTTFIFFNNNVTTAALSIEIRDDDGAPLDINVPGLGDVNPYQLVLPSGQTRILTSDGAGPIQTGSAQIHSEVDIGVSAIFSLIAADGTTLITEAGIGTAPAMTAFEFAVDAAGAFNTGLAVQNLSEDSNELTFQFFDTQGLPRGAPVKRTLAGNGHLSVFVAGEGGLLPAISNVQGKMTVSASSPVAALTLRQKVDTSNPLTTLPVVAVDSARTSFILPQIANSPLIQTSFVMFNLATTANANVSLSLTQDDGSPLEVGLSNGMSGSQFNFNIPACGVIFVKTDRAGDLTVGAAQVESDVPIGVSAIFTLFDEADNIVTEAGVGDSSQNVAFSLPVDLTRGFDTGLAIFNPNPDPANILVEFLPGDGDAEPQELAFQAAPLDLASFNHLAQFVSELIPGISEVQGQLAVTSDVPVAAMTLRQGASSLTTLPVQQGVADSSPPDPLPAVLEGLDGTSDRIVDRQLADGFQLIGRVEFPQPASELLLSVRAITIRGKPFNAALDLGSGIYCLAVPRGDYFLQVRYLTEGLNISPASLNPALIDLGNNLVITETIRLGEVEQDRIVEDLLIAPPQIVEVSGQLETSNLPQELADSDAVLYFSSDSLTARVEAEPDRTFRVGLAPGVNYTLSAQFFPIQAQATPLTSATLNSGNILIGELQVDKTLNGIEVVVPPMIILAGTAMQQGVPAQSGTVMARHFRFLSADQASILPIPGATQADINSDGTYRMALVRGEGYELTFGRLMTIGSDSTHFVRSDPKVLGFNSDFHYDLNIPELGHPVMISGRVTDSSGKGVASATVTAFSRLISAVPGVSIEARERADLDGYYSITTVRGANYEIRFEPQRPDLGPIP